MAPFLRRLAVFSLRHFCGSTGLAFKAVWLAGLVLALLSSCSRAAYVFSPGPRPYLDAERPAPSVPAEPRATARADSLPAAGSPRPPAPARRLARKLRPSAARRTEGSLPARTRRLAVKTATKRLARLAAAPRKAQPAARYGGAGPSSTLVVALCLLGAGLLGLLIGAGLSTNLAGVIFGLFFIVFGFLALAAGVVLLLIALLANE